MTVAVLKAEEWPDLWEQTQASFRSLWPEYNHHGNLAGQYLSIVFPRYAKLQILLYDEQLDRVIGRGRTIPFRWDGTAADLPRRIDELGMRAVQDDRAPTALAALAAEVVPDRSGQGLSRVLIESMVEVAAAAGLGPLVAPVRPSRKDRYPITPIEAYARWRRPDGLLFDPWMRVHERLGATIVRPEPRSMRITGAVADWERWTRMEFPEDGTYVFPGGLAPLYVGSGTGRYWEPNVWMLHEVRPR